MFRQGERMVHKYGMAIRVIILSGGILAVQGALEFSEVSRSLSAQWNYSRVEVIRAPQKLVLRSASALVEDQRTGECLVMQPMWPSALY
jgi:hypothetical protein